MDNSNYTPSELIDLALDCELDNSQAESLFELLANDNTLQEEFRQAVAIRRALANDVLAGIPTLEFTKSLFQRAGVEMPADITPAFFAKSNVKWVSLATTAIIFIGIGILSTLKIISYYSGQDIQTYDHSNQPNYQSLDRNPETKTLFYNDKQIYNGSKNSLSPFHTPTYHHTQKDSIRPTDGITIMSVNNQTEQSVGLTSEKSMINKPPYDLNKLTVVAAENENTLLNSISMNYLNIENTMLQKFNMDKQPLIAIDYNHMRGNAMISKKYGSLGSEITPPIGIKNAMAIESKYALDFSGINEHIVIENIPRSIGVNSTTTAWIFKTIEAVNQQWIVGMGARQSLVVQKDGRVAMTNYLSKGRSDDLLNTGYWCTVADTTKVQLNTWVHYAGVVETDNRKTTLKLFRDGKLVNQKTFDYTVNGNPGCDGFIGGVQLGYKSPECYFTYPQSFIGQIDEISIWNRSLSQIEITSIMNRQLNLEENGLIGYWPFEEGSGIMSKDKSKFSNHAILLNGTTWVKLR